VTTRIEDDLEEVLDGDLTRLVERVSNARRFATAGAKLGSVVPVAGSVVGATLGAIGGFILGDDYITFTMPMIAIPAHEAFLLSRPPTQQVYIRAGETLVPTGGNVTDVAEGVAQATSLEQAIEAPKPRKKTTAYQRRYKKAFKAIAPKHKLKNGKWKKGGFKAAVKAAHKQAGRKK
jgi:hypothetical protein